MKKIIFCSIALLCFALFSFRPHRLHTDTYKIDTQQSKLEWFAEKLTGKHNGTIQLAGGEIQNNHGALTGTVEVDMTTIKDVDLQDEKYRSKLEGHLKSEDFFNVAEYPKSTFVITSITPIADAKPGSVSHNVKGNLTIKDKTNPVAFDAIIASEPNKMTCTGSAVIDRSKYDVRYGSKSFFPDIGDKIIYDDFTLKFSLVAVK